MIFSLHINGSLVENDLQSGLPKCPNSSHCVCTTLNVPAKNLCNKIPVTTMGCGRCHRKTALHMLLKQSLYPQNLPMAMGQAGTVCKSATYLRPSISIKSQD